MYGDLLRDQARLLGDDVAVIFDVGTHTGHSTLDYLSTFPKAHVFSFEPEAKNFSEAAAVLGGNSRCNLYPDAISDTDGAIELRVNSHHATHSIYPIGEVEYWDENCWEVDRRSVRAWTLDTFASKHAIERIDILKMDIQGAELAALRGAQTLLASARISLIALEVEFRSLYEGQPLFWDIGAFLHQLGYSFYKLYDEKYHARNKNALCWADAIFLAPGLATLLQDQALHVAR